MEFKDLPEAPFSRHWLLGHTPAFAGSTLGFVQGCIEAGLPMARARIAFRDFVVLLKPELVQQVLQKNHRKYKKSFAYKGLREFLGNGLLTSEGDFWLKQRRTMQQGFRRPSLAGLEATMRGKSIEFAQDLVAGKGDGQSLQTLFLALTREITADCLFGKGLLDKEGAKVLDQSLGDLRQYANDRLKNPLKAPDWIPTAFNRRFKLAVQNLYEIVNPIVTAEQGLREEGGLLDMLLQMKDPETGEEMDLAQVFDEIVTLFVAGQETTTHALIFVLYLLNEHPRELEKCRSEGEEYLDAVIKESMRLYPPAWAVSREAIEPDELDGYSIPVGTTIFLSIYAIHRHPDHWKDPEAFRPERFLENPNPTAYYPFGFGPRVCIGNHFAIMEMREVLAALLQKVSWTFEKDQDFSLITPMTLSFKHPVRVQWKRN